MKRPRYEVAQIIRTYGQDFVKAHPQSAHHLRTLQALAKCRTAALGGHLDRCESCSHKRISYNSCRNRHCPKCQGLARERWKRAREADLLPVDYFHLVFTLPHQLNPLCIAHPKLIYNLLFQTAWQTIKTFADDPKYLGAKTGMTAILHTWGQNLSLHPHIHCILPAGGLTRQGKWKAGKGKGKFLFPVKAMSKVFRAKLVAALRKMWKEGKLSEKNVKGQPHRDEDFKTLCHSLFRKPWVVYAKKPFSGPQQVIQYLARYTHRIAIANHRINKVEQGKVSFRAKDYRKGGKKKTLCLDAHEFLRRFALHILPRRFVRIRHFGLLAPNQKKQALRSIREQLGQPQPEEVINLSWKQLLKETTGIDLEQCPKCKHGKMIPDKVLPRAPPDCSISPLFS